MSLSSSPSQTAPAVRPAAALALAKAAAVFGYDVSWTQSGDDMLTVGLRCGADEIHWAEATWVAGRFSQATSWFEEGGERNHRSVASLRERVGM